MDEEEVVEQPMAEEQPMAGGEANLEEEMSKETNIAIKELFQAAYKSLYSGGALESMIDKIEEGADPVKSVSLLLTTVMNDMVQKGGVTNLTILFNTGVLLMTDILHTLSEIGIEFDEPAGQEIIGNVVKGVLLQNEEMAKTVMTNPEMAKILEFKNKQEGSPGPGVRPPNQPGRNKEALGKVAEGSLSGQRQEAGVMEEAAPAPMGGMQ